jgi:hypothetical protein
LFCFSLLVFSFFCDTFILSLSGLFFWGYFSYFCT